MNPADLDLARRAVACKGWRWLSGMRGIAADGRTDRIMDDSEARQTNADLLPDLSDPCTLGGLLHLVREAWGDDAIYTIPEMGLTGWACCTRRMTGRGPSEAAALVAALEAAPER